MSKIEMLRLLINQRLTEAAEEIFGVFGRTIAEYEEEISRSKLEIDRQRRLLDLSMKPHISLQLSGAAVGEQQEWRSSPDPDETEPSHIKEEEEEEEDAWPADPDESADGSEQNNVKLVLFQRGRSRTESDRGVTAEFRSQDPENADLDLQLGTSAQHAGSDLDLDLDLDEDAPEVSDPGSGNGQLDCVDLEAPLPEAVDSYICTICGRAFAQRVHWAKHVQVHRKAESKADKSYTCDICGKRLTRFDGYQKHLRIHTGEKPYSCGECGRRFSDNSNYKRHIRTHAGPKQQS